MNSYLPQPFTTARSPSLLFLTPIRPVVSSSLFFSSKYLLTFFNKLNFLFCVRLHLFRTIYTHTHTKPACPVYCQPTPPSFPPPITSLCPLLALSALFPLTDLVLRLLTLCFNHLVTAQDCFLPPLLLLVVPVSHNTLATV